MKVKNQLVLLVSFSMLLVLLAGIFTSRVVFSRTLRQSETELLMDRCKLLGEPEFYGNRQLLDRLAITQDIRITLIKDDGTVVYDSEHNTETMDNHYFREELKQTRENGSGTAVRQSITTGKETLYCAMRTSDGLYYIRVAAPYTYFSLLNKQFLSLLVPLLLMIGILVFIILYIVIRHLLNPVEALVIAGSRYATGDLEYRTYIDKPEEFHKLSDTINHMANQLQQTISGISNERNKYSSLLSSMDEGVLLLDKGKKVMISNRASKTLLDQTIEIGSRLMDIFSDLELDGLVDKTLAEGTSSQYELICWGPYRGETALLMSAGKQKTFNLHITAIKDENQQETNGAVLTFRDVTELKHLEQVRQDFVSNVSHELKTPLTSISGFSEILDNGDLKKPEIKHFAAIIHRNTIQMQTIIDDLLTLASLEKAEIAPPMQKEKLKKLLDACIEGVRFKAETKKITLTLDCPDKLELTCNPGLLKQAVINLLVNAIAYSDKHTEVILAAEEKHSYVRIWVKDHGIGIPKPEQQRIFERFYRVDKARSRSAGGTGLGLSIVKHIALIHKGTIEVDSTEGLGSTFTLTIPKESPSLKQLEEKSKKLYGKQQKV
jgi:two-component system phosphate regulon sensor histidine kinase PhoR